MRFLLLSLIFLSGCGLSQDKAPYKDMTHRYEMPPEMRGCKVYVLGGQYTDTNPLWVIVSPDGKIFPAR